MTRRASTAAPWAVLVAVVLLLTAPLLPRGYVLVGDMTFVPRQPWKGEWLGLDGSVPRAVPADAVVSLLTHVVPGDLLQEVVLVGLLLLAGAGVLRLLDGVAAVGRTAGAVAYVWSPYVDERLGIGHWGLLVGYAALPWVVRAAAALRRGEAGALVRLWPWLLLAAVGSPTGGLLALATALAVAGGGVRRLLGVLAVGVLVNLPWLLPGVLLGGGASDPAGVGAFAPAADTPLGVLGSLAAGGGGIWKTVLHPAERDVWALALAGVVLSVVALATLLRRPSGAVPARRLAVLGLVALALAWLPSTGVGERVLEGLVAHVPGAGLARDAQKWVAPYVLAVAVGLGLAVDRLRGWLVRRDEALAWLGWGVALLPVLLLPSAAWGLGGDLRPVAYPREWSQVADVLARTPDARVAVLPWSAYQRLGWNHDVAALDPAPRFFPGRFTTDTDLDVGSGRVVSGDDAGARGISRELDAGEAPGDVLRRHGVRLVLVERTAAGAQDLPAATELGGTVVHEGRELALVDLGGGTSEPRRAAAAWVLAGDVLVVVVSGGAFLGEWVRRRRGIGYAPRRGTDQRV